MSDSVETTSWLAAQIIAGLQKLPPGETMLPDKITGIRAHFGCAADGKFDADINVDLFPPKNTVFCLNFPDFVTISTEHGTAIVMSSGMRESIKNMEPGQDRIVWSWKPEPEGAPGREEILAASLALMPKSEVP